MQRTTKGLVSFFLCFALIGSAFADWEAEGKIDHTRLVQVNPLNEASPARIIEKVDGDSLTLIRPAGTIAFNREDIAEIQVNSRLRGAMVGAIVGAGIGIPLGIGINGHKPTRKTSTAKKIVEGALAGALVFGGIGALIGAAIGKNKTVYRKGY
jgi:hypothetical protein